MINNKKNNTKKVGLGLGAIGAALGSGYSLKDIKDEFKSNKSDFFGAASLGRGEPIPSPRELNKASGVLGAINSLMSLARKLKKK